MNKTKSNIYIFLIFFFFISKLTAQDIHEAVGQGNIEQIKSIIEEFPESVNSKDANGRTPLRFTDNPEIIKLLIEKGADSHIKDNRGRSPLKFLMNFALRFPGLREQKKEALSAYIESGVRFPAKGDDGKYFLHSAAQIGHKEIVEQLISNEAYLSTLNNNDGTFLHSAAFGGLSKTVQKLVNDGFKIDLKNRYGQTPIILAAMEGKQNVVEILIENKADLNYYSLNGKAAIDNAAEFGHSEIVKLLEKNGSKKGSKKIVDLSGNYLAQNKPGDKPEIFAKGIISTVHYDHSAPIFSKDGREVYWSEVYTSRGDFIYFTKEKNGKWTVPQILPFCRIGGTYMYPTLSADGQKLFFVSDLSIDGKGAGDQMNIWYVERQGEGWSAPVYVGFDKGHEYGLTIADNGNLYFMGFYEGGIGSADLYISKYENGKYAQPENLGKVINTESYEDEPYIAPDESYILFASNKPTEKSEGRIYISYKSENGNWQEPISIYSKMNFEGDVRFPHISPDRKYFFFASNVNGNWDIYWMEAEKLFSGNKF